MSQESVYDFLTDEDDEVEPAEDFLEQYDNSEDAESSDYAEVFEALRNVIDMLEYALRPDTVPFSFLLDTKYDTIV